MGLFSRKEKELCTICEQNESSKKLSDGFICKDCMKKCSPFINAFLADWKTISRDKAINAIKDHENNLDRIQAFDKTQSVGTYLEVDSVNKFWKVSSIPNVIFLYNEIIDFELLENGQTVTKGSLSGAVVGAALFGGVGAVVGSVAGKKQKQEIIEYKIKITTNNIYFPSVYIDFLSNGKVKDGSFTQKLNVKLAQEALSLLTQITNSSTQQQSTPNTTSVADEILKLKQLMDSGIISEEEFNSKKTQLLNL